MNSRTVIKKVSQQLGYSYALIEEVYNSYWKDKKEHLSDENYSTIMLEYLGKWEINSARLKTTLKFHVNELEKLLAKAPKENKGVKYTNIVKHQQDKVDFLNKIKEIHKL